MSLSDDRQAHRMIYHKKSGTGTRSQELVPGSSSFHKPDLADDPDIIVLFTHCHVWSSFLKYWSMGTLDWMEPTASSGVVSRSSFVSVGEVQSEVHDSSTWCTFRKTTLTSVLCSSGTLLGVGPLLATTNQTGALSGLDNLPILPGQV